MIDIKVKKIGNASATVEGTTDKTSANGHSEKSTAIEIPARFEKLERVRLRQMREIFRSTDSSLSHRLAILEGKWPPVDGFTGEIRARGGSDLA